MSLSEKTKKELFSKKSLAQGVDPAQIYLGAVVQLARGRGHIPADDWKDAKHTVTEVNRLLWAFQKRVRERYHRDTGAALLHDLTSVLAKDYANALERESAVRKVFYLRGIGFFPTLLDDLDQDSLELREAGLSGPQGHAALVISRWFGLSVRQMLTYKKKASHVPEGRFVEHFSVKRNDEVRDAVIAYFVSKILDSTPGSIPELIRAIQKVDRVGARRFIKNLNAALAETSLTSGLPPGVRVERPRMPKARRKA